MNNSYCGSLICPFKVGQLVHKCQHAWMQWFDLTSYLLACLVQTLPCLTLCTFCGIDFHQTSEHKTIMCRSVQKFRTDVKSSNVQPRRQKNSDCLQVVLSHFLFALYSPLALLLVLLYHFISLPSAFSFLCFH